MAKIAVYLAVLVVVAVIVGSNGQTNHLCGHNQIFSTCPSRCPKTCSNPSPICAQVCDKPARCVCAPGFVLDGNRCILLKDCPHIS